MPSHLKKQNKQSLFARCLFSCYYVYNTILYLEETILKAKWERRGNKGYFAYFRSSKYDKETQKTVTKNLYLGKTIDEAVGKLREYLEKHRIIDEPMIELLKAEGRELGIPQNDYLFSSETFNRLFYVKSTEIYESILEVRTNEEKQTLQNEFMKFYLDISSFVNQVKK